MTTPPVLLKYATVKICCPVDSLALLLLAHTVALMLLYIVVLVLALSHVAVSAPEADSLNFTVLGDWGGQSIFPYTTSAQRAIAKVMGVQAKADGSQFTFALGDNFYSYGVKDVNDKRFKETFEVRVCVAFIIKLYYLFSYAGCVYSKLTAIKMVCSVRKPRSLWQLLSGDSVHQTVCKMVLP